MQKKQYSYHFAHICNFFYLRIHHHLNWHCFKCLLHSFLNNFRTRTIYSHCRSPLQLKYLIFLFLDSESFLSLDHVRICHPIESSCSWMLLRNPSLFLSSTGKGSFQVTKGNLYFYYIYIYIVIVMQCKSQVVFDNEKSFFKNFLFFYHQPFFPSQRKPSQNF